MHIYTHVHFFPFTNLWTLTFFSYPYYLEFCVHNNGG